MFVLMFVLMIMSYILCPAAVWGPSGFSPWTSPLLLLFGHLSIHLPDLSYDCYANDTQIYVSAKNNNLNQTSSLAIV